MNVRQSIFLYAKVTLLLFGTHAAIGSATVSNTVLNTTTIQSEVLNVLEAEETVDTAALTKVSAQNNLELEQQVLLDNIPFIQQLPELARGCEVTSLTMLLQSAGVSVDKMTLASQIQTVAFRNGEVKGNPYEGFVGNMYTFSEPGYGVYHGPIVELAEKYLPDRIVDLTGQSITKIYETIQNSSPVWVITNSKFSPLDDSEFETWETSTGSVKITYREHSVLLVGYDTEFVYIHDPLADEPNKAVSRALFEQSWIQMGSQAVSYVI